jgi:hypothetical protein
MNNRQEVDIAHYIEFHIEAAKALYDYQSKSFLVNEECLENLKQSREYFVTALNEIEKINVENHYRKKKNGRSK